MTWMRSCKSSELALTSESACSCPASLTTHHGQETFHQPRLSSSHSPPPCVQQQPTSVTPLTLHHHMHPVAHCTNFTGTKSTPICFPPLSHSWLQSDWSARHFFSSNAMHSIGHSITLTCPVSIRRLVSNVRPASVDKIVILFMDQSSPNLEHGFPVSYGRKIFLNSSIESSIHACAIIVWLPLTAVVFFFEKISTSFSWHEVASVWIISIKRLN